MEIDFDPAKNDRNLVERKLSFLLIADVIDGRVAEYEDNRRDYGETRINVFGLVRGRLLAATYTMRGSVVWVISLRKTNEREQRKWLP